MVSAVEHDVAGGDFLRGGILGLCGQGSHCFEGDDWDFFPVNLSPLRWPSVASFSVMTPSPAIPGFPLVCLYDPTPEFRGCVIHLLGYLELREVELQATTLLSARIVQKGLGQVSANVMTIVVLVSAQCLRASL